MNKWARGSKPPRPEIQPPKSQSRWQSQGGEGWLGKVGEGFRWVVAAQPFFIFKPKIGEMIQFDEHIFQMGWNHQLVLVGWLVGWLVGDVKMQHVDHGPTLGSTKVFTYLLGKVVGEDFTQKSNLVAWGRLFGFCFLWLGKDGFWKNKPIKSQLQLQKVELVWLFFRNKKQFDFFVDSTSSSVLVGVRFLLWVFGCGFHIQELCFQKVWGWWFQVCRGVVLGTMLTGTKTSFVPFKGAKPVRFLTKSVRRAYPPFNVVRGMQAWERTGQAGATLVNQVVMLDNVFFFKL